MTATLQDIAERAGVSISTVSRVLNDKGKAFRIARDTRERIERTARELNYRPNQLARGLRLKQTNTIGLVAPDIANPFFAFLIKRIQNLAHDRGYSLIVCNTEEDLEQEIQHVNLLWRKRVDGLVAMPVGQESAHFLDWMQKGIPIVLLDRCFDDLSVDSVVVDNHTGAFEAVDYFIKAGHTRIAIVQGLPDTYTTNERLRGYLEAHERHGVPVDRDLIVGGDFRRHNGFVETKLLLNLPTSRRPTAIFATSDLITLGALQAIYDERLDIPDDISLIAFDDFELAPFLRCPLTAVQQPKETMGEIAVKLLLDQIQHPGRNGQRIQLKTNLVERGSVRRLA